MAYAMLYNNNINIGAQKPPTHGIYKIAQNSYVLYNIACRKSKVYISRLYARANYTTVDLC